MAAAPVLRHPLPARRAPSPLPHPNRRHGAPSPSNPPAPRAAGPACAPTAAAAVQNLGQGTPGEVCVRMRSRRAAGARWEL